MKHKFVRYKVKPELENFARSRRLRDRSIVP
jgi:hypothetical protein